MTINRDKDYTEDGAVLCETADFICVRGPASGRFNEAAKGMASWLIRNKLSGIVEAEGPDMAGAIRATFSYQRRLDKTMANPMAEEPQRVHVTSLEELLAGAADEDDGPGMN